MDPISRFSTPGSEATVRPRPIRNNSSPYRNKGFAESTGSSQTLALPQREQPWPETGERLPGLCIYPPLTNPGTTPSTTISTVIPNNREACAEKPSVGDLANPSFLLVSDAALIATAQARDDPTRQLRRPASMLSLYSSKSQLAETDASPQLDNNVRHKSRQSRFRIRQRLGRVFDPILHDTGDTRK